MSAHRYRVVVEGELGPRYASAFDGMTLCAHDGKTDLTGAIVDPSHLHGLLNRIAGLGLTVHSLTPLDPEQTQTPTRAPTAIDHHPDTNSKGPT